MYLSWIIPTHNEEKRIVKTLREVDAYLRARHFEYEILVVDNGSTDRTSFVVNALKSDIRNLKLIRTHKGGKGWAVKMGMLGALGTIRLFSDADNSTAPEHFDLMLPLFQKGYDVVISSRDSKDITGASRDVKEPKLREIFGTLGNLLVQVVAVWGIWDTQNGFKAFTKKAAEDIFGKVRMYDFSFDIEMLALARRMRYRVGMVPVRWKFDPDSKVTLGSYLKVFADVFIIRWNLMTNKYHL
ncbi:glycosyltransferase [Patescibacteria group bacterium]|nr:glycosyltransferase [Patescibacteria group bacterium]